MQSAESTRGVELSDLIFLTSFGELFRTLRPAFSKRSWPFAVMVAAAWTLSVGRRTVTAFIRQTDGKRHWTLWYKFFSVYRWSELVIAQILVGMAQEIFGLTRLVLVADDTLTGKTGPLIFGCGWFADHSAKPLRFLWGQNWVILGLSVYIEEWKRWVCFPLITRPYIRRKNGPKEWDFRTRLTLVEEMIQDVLGGLSEPLRQLGVLLVADGAYARKRLLKALKNLSIPLVSRLPSTAALYEAPVEPQGKSRGRKRKWGRRMAKLEKIVQEGEFHKLVVSMYGKDVTLWVKSFVALWKPAARWPIEQAIRDGKQLMGFGDAQVRLRPSVLRLSNFGLQLQSLIGLWFFRHHRGRKPSEVAPWYAQKLAYSFADMLTLLRREMQNVRISALLGRLSARPKILRAVLEVLRKAS